MEIKNRLENENISLTLPSQRVDRFDENIANIWEAPGRQVLPLPQKLELSRDIVNKGLTNEELLRGVKTGRHKSSST